jgi:RNA polymerase sigma factor (sigma-70 family)
MTSNSQQDPTNEQRRRAVAALMGRAPVLVRYAARYAACLDDAEDAYQRAMEIALTKAPTVEPRRLMAWVYTVVRHEAMAVARERRREPLGRVADVAETADGRVAEGHAPDVAAEWRQRYLGVQEAMAALSDSQRTCLMLQSAGLSYRQIHEATGLTHRQIERSISRGRSRLRAWEGELASGAACERLRPALERAIAREASGRERARLERHVRACQPCRTALARRYAASETLAGLVPIGLVAGSTEAAGLADPGIIVGYWDRIGSAVLARIGQVMAPVVEAPAAGAGRLAAGLATVALAGLAALPFVLDPPAGAPEPVARVDAAPAARAYGPPAPAPRSAERRAGRRRTARASLPPREVAGDARRIPAKPAVRSAPKPAPTPPAAPPPAVRARAEFLP